MTKVQDYGFVLIKNIMMIREDFYQGYFDKIEQDNYVYFMYDAN